MSKFEELCKAYRQSQIDFEHFRKDCLEFAMELWDKLIAYFEIPQEQISLYQADEEGAFAPINPPMFNALTLGEDSYWQVGFGLTLYKDRHCFPQETIVVGLKLKRDSKGEYAVHIAGDEKEFVIDRTKETDFQGFFDYIYEKIMQSYKSGVRSFIDQDTTERMIGFKLGELLE